MKEELFKKVCIKTEADLPIGDRTMYFVGVKDNLNPEDVYEWFNYKNPVMANNQAEYWINTFDWYLQPIDGWFCKCGEKSTGSMKVWICNICGMEVPDEDNPDKFKPK